MYTLNEQQQSSVEGWIESLPDSMVKANYQRWLSTLNPKERVTSEQLEKFVSYANALPKEFQSYPQEFAICIKNGTIIEAADKKSKSKIKSKK